MSEWIKGVKEEKKSYAYFFLSSIDFNEERRRFKLWEWRRLDRQKNRYQTSVCTRYEPGPHMHSIIYVRTYVCICRLDLFFPFCPFSVIRKHSFFSWWWPRSPRYFCVDVSGKKITLSDETHVSLNGSDSFFCLLPVRGNTQKNDRIHYSNNNNNRQKSILEAIFPLGLYSFIHGTTRRNEKSDSFS